MRHGLLAIAVLLGATLLTAQAEYIRFIYNPGVAKKDAPKPGESSGQPGGPAGNQMAAILAQLPPAMRAQFQQMTPQQQQQAIQQYMGSAGAGASDGIGGGISAVGGGRGGALGRGGAFGRGGAMGRGAGEPGVSPGGIPGGLPGVSGGAGVGVPGGALGGISMGEGGVPGMLDPSQMPEEELDLSAIKIELIVESSRVEPWKEFQGRAYKVLHKYGMSAVDPNDLKDRDIIVQRILERDSRGRAVPMPTRLTRWEAKIADYKKKKGYPTPELVLELAEYALTHALQEQFDQKMAELGKMKPDHPSAVAYKKYLEVDFKRNSLKDDPASAWSNRLGEFREKRTDHYLIRYGPENTAEAIQTYAKLLEDNYRAFFSWFALKGQYRPTPEYRLVVVLSEKADEFNALQKVFETIVLPAEGFMSRRDNLTVMAGNPLDEGYDSLERVSQPLWVQDGWNKDLCLKGDYKTRGGRSSVQDISYAHTVALILRGVEEQIARQAVTHVGTLQLATACGLLPRTVTAPHWVQFGIGSFFETPREAYWPGTGAPHWNYLTKFQLWKDAKKLDRPDEALRKVVTDAYFHEAHADQEARTDHDRDAIVKARTMTWSLTYFLAQQHLEQLLRYYQELANMPRDMEFGEEALAALFVKAFDLGEGPAALGSAKAKQLAQKWYEYMIRDTHVEVAEVKTLAKAREEARIKKLEEIAKAKKEAAEQAAAAKAAAQMQALQGGQFQPPGTAIPGSSAAGAPNVPPRSNKFSGGRGTVGDR